LSEPREVYRQSQTKVTYLGGAIGPQPDVAGLDVSMDNSFGVGELQTTADGLRNSDCLVDGQAMLRGLLNQTLHITTGHDRDNDIGLSFMLTYIVDSHNVGMVAKPTHCSSFAVDTGSRGVIQFFGFDEGKGHITVQKGIMGEVDLLLATLAQEFLDLVAAIRKRGRLR
jgi:hypothetical protein